MAGDTISAPTKVDLSTSIPISAIPTSNNQSPNPSSIPDTATISRMATVYGLDPDIINNQIKQESAGNPSAVSKKGAMGMMQLMPDTAAKLGVSNPFDAASNIDGGMREMSRLLGKYDGDYSKALAAYNAGEHQVDKVNGIPDIDETRNYVNSILKGTNHEIAATKPSGNNNPAGLKLDMSTSIPISQTNQQSTDDYPWSKAYPFSSSNPGSRMAENFNEQWTGARDLSGIPNILKSMKDKVESGPFTDMVPQNPYIKAAIPPLAPALSGLAGLSNFGYHMGEDTLKAHEDTANEAVKEFNQPGAANKIAGTIHYLANGVPFLGPAIVKTMKALESGDYAGALGTGSAVAMQTLMGDPEWKEATASRLDAAGKYLFSKPHVQQTILGGEAQEVLTNAKNLAKKETEASYEPINKLEANPLVTVPGHQVADTFNQAISDNIKGTSTVPAPMKEIVNESGVKSIGYMPNAQGQLREIFAKASPDTPVSLKDLQGYYSELGEFMDHGNLPGDVYRTAKQARGSIRDIIGDIYKEHSTPGTTDLYNKWEDSQRLWEDYATRFLDPDSPLKKAIDEANPSNHQTTAARPAATLAHLTGDNEALARSYLNRYQHLGVNDDIVTAAAKLNKGISQFQLRGLFQAAGGLIASMMLRSEGVPIQVSAALAGGLMGRRLASGYFNTRPTLTGLLSQMEASPSSFRAFPLNGELEEGGASGANKPPSGPANPPSSPSPFTGTPVTNPSTPTPSGPSTIAPPSLFDRVKQSFKPAWVQQLEDAAKQNAAFIEPRMEQIRQTIEHGRKLAADMTPTPPQGTNAFDQPDKRLSSAESIFLDKVKDSPDLHPELKSDIKEIIRQMVNDEAMKRMGHK